ncbi:MAG: DEAD/DEAH box helicase family protein [Patescibacteria group bacterium]|nr:DEAD/DEAH box helicase family protein [Patescibacteria group bacterium]
MDVEIKQINAVWVKVISAPDVQAYLRQHFSFEVPNFQYIKIKQKNYNWDGKIYLFSRGNLYVGLIPELVKVLDKLGKKYTINLNKIYSDVVDSEYIDAFLNSINLPFELRSYQKKLIDEGIKEKRATFLSATSSGKSICIYSLAAFWYRHLENPKILIVVPSINLVTQLYSNFIEYNSIIPESDISLVHHESNKINPDARVVISTWQSAYKWPNSTLEKFNCIFFDEVHTAKAKEISKFLEKLTNAYIRYGFTGTLDDEKIHHFIIEGLFGPRINIIGLNDLIEEGYATNLKIEVIEFKYSQKYNPKDYYDEIDFLINNNKRNLLILTLAGKLSGNTMILFHRIKHGMDLYEKAKKLFPSKNIYLIYGKTEAELREQARLIMNKDLSGNTLIIASIQIFSVGVDIPSLKNLILAHPTKSKIRLLQSIGRILRKHKTKEESKFFDFGDNLGTNNYTYEHFLKRIKYYIKENLPFKITKLNL